MNEVDQVEELASRLKLPHATVKEASISLLVLTEPTTSQ